MSMAQVTWITESELSIADDITVASNIRDEGSRSQAAVDERIAPVAAEIISSSPTVVAAAASAVSAKVAAENLLSANDVRIPRIVESTDRLVEADEADNISRVVDAQGRTWLLPHPDVRLAAGQVTGLPITTTVAPSEWAFVAVDDNDNIGIGMRYDGTTVGITTPTPTLVSIPEVTGVSPNRKLWINAATGKRRLLTATGDPHDPVVRGDGTVMFDSTAGRLWVPGAGGTPGPLLPDRTKLFTVGDSLTANGTYAAYLAAEFGMTLTNAGMPGWCSADIATRVGALRPLVTITGNQLPASGAVTITARNPDTGWRVGHVGAGNTYIDGSIYEWIGYLDAPSGPVPGTMRHDHVTTEWTFTRTDPGSVVAVPPGTAFVGTQFEAYRGQVGVLFEGRNNPFVNPDNAPLEVKRDDRLIYDHFTSYVKNVLVISVINAKNEPIGSAGYNTVVAINATKAAQFGDSYFNVRPRFITEGLGLMGITPTTADLANIANDCPPPSLMADDVHPNTAGYTAIGMLMAQEMTTTKGWLSA